MFMPRQPSTGASDRRMLNELRGVCRQDQIWRRVPHRRRKALIVANAVKLKVRQLGMHHPGAPCGNVSIGVASNGEFTPDETALIHNADIALCNAKKLGRNCVVASSTLAAKNIETAIASNS